MYLFGREMNYPTLGKTVGPMNIFFVRSRIPFVVLLHIFTTNEYKKMFLIFTYICQC